MRELDHDNVRQASPLAAFVSNAASCSFNPITPVLGAAMISGQATMCYRMCFMPSSDLNLNTPTGHLKDVRHRATSSDGATNSCTGRTVAQNGAMRPTLNAMGLSLDATAQALAGQRACAWQPTAAMILTE